MVEYIDYIYHMSTLRVLILDLLPSCDVSLQEGYVKGKYSVLCTECVILQLLLQYDMQVMTNHFRFHIGHVASTG